MNRKSESPDEEGRVPEFTEKFNDEETCWEHLRRARWGNGFRCPRCDQTEHWGFIQTRRLFQCHECGYQASVTARTILQDTKLPLRVWFLAAYLVLTTKKGISTHELARKLGIKQESAWYLNQRLACVVKRRYGRELFGLVEADETYVGGYRGAVMGRGTNRAVVVGLVEDKGGSAGDLVLRHVPDASSASIHPILEEGVDKERARVKTDGFRSYWSLPDKGFDHERHALWHGTPAHEVLPWVHIVFGNLKRVVRGVHTKASKGQLQDYLDLFSFRFNNRADLAGGLQWGLTALAAAPRMTRDELKTGSRAVVY